jgi:hypothetical protein
MNSQTKTSFNCVNLIKECITSNIYITKFKPNKVFTLVSKDKLDLVEGIVGASNAILMKTNTIFKQKKFDKIDHRDPS